MQSIWQKTTLIEADNNLIIEDKELGWLLAGNMIRV